MFVDKPYLKNYLMKALEAGPELVSYAMESVSPDLYDVKFEDDRFTIREVIAHLADWEPIFLLRMRRMVTEAEPVLADLDEGQIAIDHNYAASDIKEQLALFRERRGDVIAFLRSLETEAWRCNGLRPEIGLIDVETIAMTIPLHDTYHLKQIEDYRRSV